MAEDTRDHEAAREAVQVPWDELREARNLKRVLAAWQHERATVPRQAAPASAGVSFTSVVVLVSLAAVAVTLLALVRLEPPASQQAPEPHMLREQTREAIDPVTTSSQSDTSEPATTDAPLILPDGSRAYLRSGAQVELGLVELGGEAERVRVQQRAGRVRYDVPAHADARVMEVEAGWLSMRVDEAVFEVEVDPAIVEVTVLDGQLELREQDRRLVLAPGDQVRLSQARREHPVQPSHVDKPVGQRASTAPASVDAGPSADELMRRADLARAEGRLADATAELRTLIDRHADSPLVGVALLTLARVESKRGRHARAAEAFAEHGRRFAGDPLAEDALAGAAAQWALAGETRRSRELAATYLERFPNGLHRPAMLDLLAQN